MFPTLEMRHLLAVITLAESMNFTRAAQKLNITQSGFSKQISEIEDQLGFKLFTRDGKRVIDLTDAGKVFVEHARLSVLHHQRAIQLANSTHEGAERFLHVGHCPYLDHKWLTTLLSVRLPLYPGLKIELCSDFVPELIGNLLTGALDLALVNGPPDDNQITAVSLSREPLTVVLPERHSASGKSHLRLADLANDSWITFQPRANPGIHQAILSTAQHESVRPKRMQHVMTPQEAFDSVAEGLGVAVRYATLFYGEFDSQTRVLRYINAGHTPPILISAQGEVTRLSDGDLPDGVSDARNSEGEEFGEERIMRCLTSLPGPIDAEGICKHLAGKVAEWADGVDRSDDTTILALSVE